MSYRTPIFGQLDESACAPGRAVIDLTFELNLAMTPNTRDYRPRVVSAIARPGALLFAIIAVAACASTPHPEQAGRDADSDTARLPIVVRPTDSAGISGVVRYNGNPLQSVEVDLRGTTVNALSDVHGHFSMRLVPGPYALFTKRIGYYSRTDTVQVPSEGGLYVEIPLRERPIRLDATCHRLPSGESIC